MVRHANAMILKMDWVSNVIVLDYRFPGRLIINEFLFIGLFTSWSLIRIFCKVNHFLVQPLTQKLLKSPVIVTSLVNTNKLKINLR